MIPIATGPASLMAIISARFPAVIFKSHMPGVVSLSGASSTHAAVSSSCTGPGTIESYASRVAKPPFSPIQSYAVYMFPVLHPLSWWSHTMSCFTDISSMSSLFITAHRPAMESAETNAQQLAQMSCWLCTGPTTRPNPGCLSVQRNSAGRSS